MGSGERPTVPVNVWALLTDALGEVVAERPPDSVTIEEYAAKARVTTGRAAQVLRATPGLRAVQYRRESGRRAVCYVEAK